MTLIPSLKLKKNWKLKQAKDHANHQHETKTQKELKEYVVQASPCPRLTQPKTQKELKVYIASLILLS